MRNIIALIAVLLLAAGIGACGNRGEPVRPSDVENARIS